MNIHEIQKNNIYYFHGTTCIQPLQDNSCCKDSDGEIRVVTNKNLNKLLTFPLVLVSKEQLEKMERMENTYVSLKSNASDD
jgi:hypothetical protein